MPIHFLNIKPDRTLRQHSKPRTHFRSSLLLPCSFRVITSFTKKGKLRAQKTQLFFLNQIIGPSLTSVSIYVSHERKKKQLPYIEINC